MPTSLLKRVARSVRDPALSGRWFCLMPESNTGSGLKVDAREVLVEHMTSSFHKTPAKARYTNGTHWHYPDVSDLDGITAIFYETWDYRVTRWLQEWRREVYNPDNNEYGLPDIYRRNILIEFYPYDKQDVAVMKKTYEGCFPTDQTPFEHSYAEIEGRLTVTAQFQVRRMKMEWPGG